MIDIDDMSEDEKLALRMQLEEFIVKAEWEGGTLYVLENWPSMVPDDTILQNAAQQLQHWNQIFEARIDELERRLIYGNGSND